MEPRMRPRQKGPQFAVSDLEAYLVAFGDDHEPLKETVKSLDEIVTDYIIETCHAAALCASHARRTKIKVDDFKFVLRRDPIKLGRVLELHSMQREIKTKKRMFEVDEKRLGRDTAAKETKEVSELSGPRKKTKAGAKKNVEEQDGGDGGSSLDALFRKSSVRRDDLNEAVAGGLLADDGDDLIDDGEDDEDDADDDDDDLASQNPKKRQRLG